MSPLVVKCYNRMEGERLCYGLIFEPRIQVNG